MMGKELMGRGGNRKGMEPWLCHHTAFLLSVLGACFHGFQHTNAIGIYKSIIGSCFVLSCITESSGVLGGDNDLQGDKSESKVLEYLSFLNKNEKNLN